MITNEWVNGFLTEPDPHVDSVNTADGDGGWGGYCLLFSAQQPPYHILCPISATPSPLGSCPSSNMTSSIAKTAQPRLDQWLYPDSLTAPIGPRVDTWPKQGQSKSFLGTDTDPGEDSSLALGRGCQMWQLLAKYIKRRKKESEVAQSCPTLCGHMDCSLPGSSVHGLFQARILERVAISFSNAWKWKVKVKSLSCIRLLVTPWTAAYQAPPSMDFSRQEYWSGVPLPSPDVGLKNFKSKL